MDSTEPAVAFRDVRLDELRRAIAIYLGIAYPSGEVPEPVRRRLAWADADGPDAVLGRPPFETAGRAPAGPIVALRLGNAQYPHMKLQVQPWDHDRRFLLSVNTHDEALAPAEGEPDAPARRALQSANQRIKEVIEAAWDAAGLPTFNGFMRDYIANHPGGG